MKPSLKSTGKGLIPGFAFLTDKRDINIIPKLFVLIII